MTDKLELDIPVLLPEVPDAADACVGRLISILSAKPGVERALQSQRHQGVLEPRADAGPRTDADPRAA